MDGNERRCTCNRILIKLLTHNPLMKKFLAGIICLIGFYQVSGQNTLDLSFHALKTEQKNAAVGFAFQYLKPYLGMDAQLNGSRSFLTFTPEMTVQEGTADAFSQIVAKFSGYYLVGQLGTITDPDAGGAVGIDPTKLMHLFPFSVGAETNSDFHFANVLAEAGYVPFYQSQTNTHVSDFLKHTQIGFFLQGGYKSLIDSANRPTDNGGKRDESKESLNNGLFRAKTIVTIDTKNFFQNASHSGVGLIGKGTYWFDFLNNAFYYQNDVRVRIYLNNTKFFDLVYQKGSGAPNFNTGDQFGTALTIQF